MVTKNVVIEVILEGVIANVLGVEAEISSVRVDVLNKSVKLNDLHIFGPGSHGKEKLAYFPEIYLKMDVGRLIKGKVYFDELYIYLSELELMKNKNGDLKIQSLKCFKKRALTTEVQEEKIHAKRTIFAEELRLKAGKVYYGNYSKSDHPQVHEIEINFDKKYKNVEDLYSLIKTVVTEIKRHNKLTHIFGLPVSGVKGFAGAAYKISEGTVETAVKVASGGEKDIF